MWRMPPEIVEQKYHSFSHGYGKVSHSGYHFLDMCYMIMKMGWGENKRPDRAEVVSSFITPNGFLTSLNEKDYKGIGRVKHEFHEIKSGPLQTVVLDSRQANDKHDRSVPSTAKMGSDNHFEVQSTSNNNITVQPMARHRA